MENLVSKLVKTNSLNLLRTEDFLATIGRLKLKRAVRPVVTRSGHRARGRFPSIKASKPCRYESLVELGLQRILEVSSLTKHLASHPYVLGLRCPYAGDFEYTPDLEVRMAEHSVLLEAKGSYFLETPEQRTRLRKIIAALKAEKIHLIVILDSEIQEPGFQEDLEDIRRVRPLVGHFRPNLNKDLFDPLGNAPREPELVRRWTAAQAECDAFLTRIMRRDPDDLVPAEQN